MDGAGVLDKSIQNTTDLQAMRYNQAMLTADKQEWQNAVELEHERMIENNKSEIPNKAKSSTWAMKQKANSKFCAQINACGYEQVDGVHYASEDTAAPVASDAAIKLVMVLVAMAGFTMHILDAQGAFLIG
jgi:hypothetical protein